MPSENNCIIEDVDNEVNFLNPYDFNDSDSFDSSDDDDGNCVDTFENNSFNSNDNDGLESFTFDDNSLINEHVGELHDMLCNDDDELNVDASLLDLNDVEFDTFHDNCLDDAIYIHDLLGEEKEETDGDLRDVLLSSEKEEVEKSVTIEKENEEENFENEKVLFEEVHGKIIKEEKEKTRDESVREEVEEKANTFKSYPTGLSLSCLICTVGALQASVVALVAERGNPATWALHWDIKLLAYVYSGVIGSGVAYYLSGVIMKEKGPVFVTAFNPLNMIIVAILGSFMLAEQLDFGKALGAGVIVIGLYMVLWGKNQDHQDSQESIHDQVASIDKPPSTLIKFPTKQERIDTPKQLPEMKQCG
nr:WAT1-related protein At2g39510-like [Ipomoea batatas]